MSQFPTTFEEKKAAYKKSKKGNESSAQLRSQHQDGAEGYIDRPRKLKTRGRPKKNPRKRLSDIAPEEREIDPEQERMEREEEKRIREEAKPLTAAQVRDILGEDDFQRSSSSASSLRERY